MNMKKSVLDLFKLPKSVSLTSAAFHYTISGQFWCRFKNISEWFCGL